MALQMGEIGLRSISGLAHVMQSEKVELQSSKIVYTPRARRIHAKLAVEMAIKQDM
ncbi:hypothetical protein [Paenibacillus koleovorans]|uniref:hypothetical protein n=1 Tax=Paenibacillus koleovorans TaxID=121608 RepID=UPI0013E2AE81|nr:hypothetical protein [Paenibacillus koleovorans]